MQEFRPTPVERLILANQYRILALLDKDHDNVKSYQLAEQAFVYGYESAYLFNTGHLATENILTEEEGREVSEILRMYDHIQYSHKKLGAKSGIEPHEVVFPGFSGNYESKQLAFCDYLGECKMRAKIKVTHESFDSHFPMLHKYRSMLSVWRQFRVDTLLTADQIRSILAAA